MREHREMIKRGVLVGIFLISCFCCFLFGKHVGERNVQAVQVVQNEVQETTVWEESVRNPDFAGENQDNDYVVEGVVTVNVSGNDAGKEEILLVNRANPLSRGYEVTLITLPDGVNRAAEEAYEPLCEMLSAGRKEGLRFEICSSYRDVKRQQELFEEDVEVLMNQGYSYWEAFGEVAKETMPPGYSEHSTGLAFDIVALGYQMLDEGQEKTAENKWLQEHCAEYGFILRYPKGKEDITAISYESWHFRYVGKEIAEYIMENGITLEEYVELQAE